jgi:hypothetical protein
MSLIYTCRLYLCKCGINVQRLVVTTYFLTLFGILGQIFPTFELEEKLFAWLQYVTQIDDLKFCSFYDIQIISEVTCFKFT